MIYWGTGNPGPDWNGDVRLGDNLYSDSVLALNGDSGEIDWHFQFTPHDVHDYDSIQTPLLADIAIDGRDRKAMLWANRNGFFYTLDRSTGEFLKGKAYATQTWAQGLDAAGRPVRVAGMAPSYEGTLVAPQSLAQLTGTPLHFRSKQTYSMSPRSMASKNFSNATRITKRERALPAAVDVTSNQWMHFIARLGQSTPQPQK